MCRGEWLMDCGVPAEQAVRPFSRRLLRPNVSDKADSTNRRVRAGTMMS